MQFMDKWVKPGLVGAFDLVPQCGCIMDLVRIWILFAIKLGLCSRILHLHPLIDFEKKWIEEEIFLEMRAGTSPGWLCLVALRCFSCFLPQRQSFRFLAGLRSPSPGVLLPERLPEVLPCPEFSDQWRQHQQQARVEVGGGRMASPSSTTTSSSPYTGRHSTKIQTQAEYKHRNKYKTKYKYKTLPKTQRTRGLSSYHKLSRKFGSNLIFKTLTKPSFRISSKIQLHNLNQTYWPKFSFNLAETST